MLFFTAVLLILLAVPQATAQEGAASAPGQAEGVVTNLFELMHMAHEKAALELPVEVEGVVTQTYDDAGAVFFIHDGHCSTYVENTHPTEPVHFGDRLRIHGNTYAGAFSPMIRSSKILRLGAGTIPPALPASYPQLVHGALDSQWLEIRGVVQSVKPWPSAQGASLDFSMEGGRLELLVGSSSPIDPAELVDAEVRVKGVASGSFNKKGQIVAPVFRAENVRMIEVLKPAQSNCFDLPLHPMNQILRFSPNTAASHRIRVRGTVTACQPGQTVYLCDGQDSLKVETTDTTAYQPGDVIDVFGFAEMSTYSPQLCNAICRRVEKREAPLPTEPTLDSVLGGLHDAELIKLRAKLLDWVMDDNGVTLALQSERSVFKAYLLSSQVPSSWSIEKNTVVEVTGICDVKELEKAVWYYQPRSFLVLMRSAQDLTILQRPPWLNATRLLRVVSVMGLLLGLAAIWVWALRREIRRTRAFIEHQAGKVAVMEERTRIARDLHDTVEQGLTGLSLQLKALETSPRVLSEEIRGELQSARRTLGNTRALTHYAVQELRQDESLSETLREGLERTAEFWNRTGALRVDVRFAKDLPPVPKPVGQHLLAIAREAVTNSVKHGQATAVDIELASASGQLCLRIKDNGLGFDPDSAEDMGGGHFGIQGMRERIQQCRGRLEIRSHPNQGAEIELTVPLGQAGNAGN